MSDFQDQVKAEQRLREAANKLHAMVPNIASARQIKEFSSDQRKSLLARFMAPMLSEKSATTADALARANPDYIAGLKTLEEQYRDAERVIAEWQATQATFEAARTIVSLLKEQMRQIE